MAERAARGLDAAERRTVLRRRVGRAEFLLEIDLVRPGFGGLREQSDLQQPRDDAREDVGGAGAWR